MDSPQAEGATEHLYYVRGMPITVVFTKENVEDAMDYVPHDGDIIIATYPKTGTTWMQYIVQQILTKGEDFPELNDMMEKIFPYMEMVGVAAVDALKIKPRVYKHHLPYNMVKKNPKAKIIYVYRKPEDTFISYYHFMSNVVGQLDFEQFFEGFVSGRISYGRYFEHVFSFQEYKNDPNLLLVSYEKLKLDPRGEILRTAKFLGEEYYDAISSDEAILSKILEHTSFEYMKKNLTFTIAEDPKTHGFSKNTPQKKINFFRKGAVGDGKQSLTEDKLVKIREVAEEVLKGTDVLAEWYGN